MKKILIIGILTLSVFLIGCTVQLKKQSPAPTAGIYKSFDKGNTWRAKNLFVSAQGFGDMGTVGVNGMVFDPQDNLALYLISDGDGLFYSYDGGESWVQPKQFTTGTITSLAVDPHDKCTIYLAYSNQIYKSTDCNRTYSAVYTDSRPKKIVTALSLDAYNVGIVYAGTDNGEVLKSFDSGLSWTTIARLDNKVEKILVDLRDTRIIYVATQKKGIYKSTDSGATWQDVNEELKKFSAGLEYKDLIFIPSQADSLILLSRYGLLKTTDGGQTWQAIDLITPPLSADIRTVAVSPENSQEIYYGTPSTFYKTVDGGQNWITSRLPTGSPASKLIIDPENPNILYLGFSKIKK